jgi:uncharacterized protein YndB with AHSA1/START domain
MQVAITCQSPEADMSARDHAPSFTTSFTVDRSPLEVFAAVSDVRAWWLEQIEGDPTQVGAEFGFSVPGVHRSRLQVTELDPGERVVWRVLENSMSFVQDQSEWVGTDIRFDLAAVDGGTAVRFTHVGLTPEDQCYDVCSHAWAMYLEGSLRRLLTTGQGSPSSNPDEERLQEAPADPG